MYNSYQIIQRHDDYHRIVNGLTKEEELAVGIMDTGSLKDLEQSIIWFRKNYNHNIHVIAEEARIDKIWINALPDVTFIVFNNPPSLAQRINALANTCASTYFMVTRSDTDLVDIDWKNIKNVFYSEPRPVAVTPIIFNKSKELIPSVRGPQIKDDEVEPESFMPTTGTDKNLYPFLGLGVYNRVLFQRLRGFDENITGAYWQVLDFGTRAWLYGYAIYSVNYLALIFFNKQFLIEDRSETLGYSRFYSKAMCVKMIRGKIRIKKHKKADRRILSEEVKQKAGLYKTDFESLCDSWESREEDQ